VARERAKNLKSSAKFVCADVMGYEGPKSDGVIAMELIEHFYDPKEVLAKLASMTTPDGWVYITTPNGPYGNGRGNAMNWDSVGSRGHVRVFVVSTLKEVLKDYEVKFISARTDGLLYAQYRRRK